MLERAGLKGIVNAMHSTHPLLREIAGSAHIMQGQNEIRSWYYTLENAHRTPAKLQDKALETMLTHSTRRTRTEVLTTCCITAISCSRRRLVSHARRAREISSASAASS
jgi:hypothetical protein